MIFKQHGSFVSTDLLGLCENPGRAVARLVQAERVDGVGAGRLLQRADQPPEGLPFPRPRR